MTRKNERKYLTLISYLPCSNGKQNLTYEKNKGSKQSTGEIQPKMKKTLGILVAVMVLAVGTVVLIAQNAGGQAGGRGGAAQAPAQPMSFFVTSVGKGDGANYGGLAGADAYCQSLAAT